jgi:hypothetical protein
MRFGKFVGLVLVTLGCAAAQAQFGVYGTYSATRMNGIQCLDPSGHCSSGGGVVSPSGLGGGVYYDFKTLGPLRLGIDARGGIAKSNKSAVNSSGGDGATISNYGLAGVRAQIHVPYTFLKPYVEAAAGIARSDATEPYTLVGGSVTKPYDNFVQYQGIAGVDVKVLPILDLRAIELGIGNMNRIGSGNGTSSVGVKTIGVGIVLHLP